MRTGTLLLLAVAAVAGAVGQEQKGGARQPNDTEAQTLIDVENGWVQALVKADVTTLEALLADTYVDTDEHSHRGNRDDVLSFVKSGDVKFDSIKLSDIQVHVYGDAAVVTGKAVQKGTFLGGPVAEKILFTDMFIKQNGRWRAVASHRSVGS